MVTSVFVGDCSVSTVGVENADERITLAAATTATTNVSRIARLGQEYLRLIPLFCFRDVCISFILIAILSIVVTLCV